MSRPGWIRVTDRQAAMLRKVWGCCGDPDIVALLAQLTERDQEGRRPDRRRLLQRARRVYANPSNHDVEVDNDAPFSRAQDGVWVQGWLWLSADYDAAQVAATEGASRADRTAATAGSTTVLPVEDR